jgi:hypothetical protein
MMNTTEFSVALRPGIKKWYGDEATRLSKQAKDFVPVLYNVDNSEKAYEEIAELIGFGLFQELTEGNGIDFDAFKKGRDTKFIHTDFSKGFRVTRKMMRDKQYDLVSRQTKALARMAYKTVRYRSMLPLALGFGSTDASLVWNSGVWGATAETYVLGDGKPVFDAAHPIQNVRDVAGYSLPTTWNNAGAVAFSETNLLAACTALETQPDENGFVAGYMPKTLIVPSALHYSAAQVLDSKATVTTQMSSGVVNEASTLGINLLVIPELPDTGAWYVVSEPQDREAYFFWREKPGKLESDTDFNTKDLLWSMIFSCSCGFASGKGMYGSLGA